MKHVGRKLYHLLGGLVLLSFSFLFSRPTALAVYAFLFVVLLAVDVARLRVPALNRFVQARFSSFIRENEADGLTGTAPYVLGVGLTMFLFRQHIAATAVCFLAFGDVAATAVGERYGRTKIAGAKSLEGTIAFVAAAVLAGMCVNVLLGANGAFMHFGVPLAGAVVAAAVELVPWRVNDNLAIPLISGGAMELIAQACGCA